MLVTPASAAWVYITCELSLLLGFTVLHVFAMRGNIGGGYTHKIRIGLSVIGLLLTFRLALLTPDINALDEGGLKVLKVQNCVGSVAESNHTLCPVEYFNSTRCLEGKAWGLPTSLQPVAYQCSSAAKGWDTQNSNVQKVDWKFRLLPFSFLR